MKNHPPNNASIPGAETANGPGTRLSRGIPSSGGPFRSPRLLAALGLALAVLATIIYIGKEHLRLSIREQIARRDAEILHAVALMHQQNEVDYELDEEDAQLEQFNLMLEISRLKGVIAVRLYDANGSCLDVFPAYVLEGAPIAENHLLRLQALKPMSIFHEQVKLNSVLADGREHTTAPLLEVLVPLRSAEGEDLSAIAQFIIEGNSIAQEYAMLARNLNSQAILIFLAGGAVLIIGLGLSFHQLERSNRLLETRTASLLKANEELALALKTSAVGSVTSHLLHGLKNPLAGLQDFVSSRGEGDNDAGQWEEAEAAAARMRKMINDILDLLREDGGFGSCDLSLREMGAVVCERIKPVAEQRRVEFLMRIECEQSLSSRVAQLTSLILVNLVENGIEATPPGGIVQLSMSQSAGGITLQVQDQGGGIPRELEPRLFSPVRSTKTNGSGLGLALCSQIAKQLGAELALKHNSAAGCRFELSLPHAVLAIPTPCKV